jgi:hypothetical protein
VDGNYITLPELAFLGAVLGAPVYLLGLAVQVAVLRRLRIAGPRNRIRVASVGLISCLLAYLLTFVVWMSIPFPLLDWRPTFGSWPLMWLGLFFTPAVLAGVLVFPAIGWCTASMWRAAQQRDAPDEAR